MTAEQVLVALAAFLVAGVAKGAVGMGLPPIAIGLMTLAVPLGDALALVVLPTITTNLFQALYGGRFVTLLRRFGTMAAAAIAGVIGVAVILGQLGAPAMIGWLGLLLVLYAGLALVAWRPTVPRDAEAWANPLVGIASGAVAGLTGIAAMPFLPYMQSLQIARDELVQGLGIMFIFIMGALAVALAQQNVLTAVNSLGSAAAIAPTFLGVWLGQKLRRRFSPEMFRRVFLFGLLAIGLHMSTRLL
ncbi:MAG: sulfite exporter TauE/SafE family protein [Enhydrobacter sp.]|nr:MAG: sulfite exporter TauE/SafE family protein [Enhydrobacter sp.]